MRLQTSSARIGTIQKKREWWYAPDFLKLKSLKIFSMQMMVRNVRILGEHSFNQHGANDDDLSYVLCNCTRTHLLSKDDVDEFCCFSVHSHHQRKHNDVCTDFPTTPSSLTANAMISIAAKLLPSEFYFMGFSS